jgi:salicylate hydroxylase
MERQNIAIIGAGLGGLTAAVALQRKGHKVTVYEAAPHLGEVGAGITLSPNAMRILEQLGLRDAIAAVSDEPTRQCILHFQTGKILVDQPRGGTREKYGADYFQLHRADLHTVLSRAVAAHDVQTLRLGAKITAVDQDGTGVTLVFENGERVRADAAIAADGVRSIIRDVYFNPTPPKFTGHIAWRGLVPIERIDPALMDPPSGVYIAPGKMIARYLIRHGKTVNYVAFSQREGWAEEGWNIHSTTAELLAEFEGWHESIRTIIAATPPELCYKWALYAREPLDHWVKGRVGLLGDAAHAMLPFMGQGAASAIEDAIVLARAFDAASTVEESLLRYEKARRDRANWVQAESRANGMRMEGKDTDAYDKSKHKNEEALGLFEYDASRVPV